MDSDLFHRACDVYFSMAGLEPANQAAFLEKECGDDAALRTQVESLVRGNAAGKPGPTLVNHVEVTPWAPESVAGFRLVEELRHGPVATVFRAEHAATRRAAQVALIHPDLVQGEVKSRFEFVSQSVQRLHHPAIPRLLHYGIESESRQNQPFWIFEASSGPSLRSAVSADMDRKQVVQLMAQVCSAIECAHHAGLAHLALNPDAIVVEAKSQARVLDLGLAMIPPPQALHRCLDRLGTDRDRWLSYLSPEIINKDEFDQRADVYTLGAIAFEMLGGNTPFEVLGLSSFQTTLRLEELEIPLLGSLDSQCKGDLEDVVARALVLDPDQRTLEAGEFSRDLAQIAEGERIGSVPDGLIATLANAVRANPFTSLASVAAVLLGAAALAFGGAYFGSAGEREHTVQALGRVGRAETDSLAARRELEALQAQLQADSNELETARTSAEKASRDLEWMSGSLTQAELARDQLQADLDLERSAHTEARARADTAGARAEEAIRLQKAAQSSLALEVTRAQGLEVSLEEAFEQVRATQGEVEAEKARLDELTARLQAEREARTTAQAEVDEARQLASSHAEQMRRDTERRETLEGTLAREIEKRQQAEAELASRERALQQANRRASEASATLAQALTGADVVVLQLLDADQHTVALDLAALAYSAAQEILSESSPARLQLMASLGWCEFQAGDSQRGRVLLRQAVAGLESLENADETLVNRVRAWVKESKGD